MSEQTPVTDPSIPPPPAERKLSLSEQFVCALPLALVVIGGAVGGLFGGLAWYLNQKVMKSDRSLWQRYGFVVLSFLGGFACYLICVMIIGMLFPGLFNRP